MTLKYVSLFYVWASKEVSDFLNVAQEEQFIAFSCFCFSQAPQSNKKSHLYKAD